MDLLDLLEDGVEVVVDGGGLRCRLRAGRGEPHDAAPQLLMQVGGLGLAPGANIGDNVAIFEATHGTAPKYAGQDKVNPSSLILSGAMMFDYMGWAEAARAVENAVATTIANKTVTYDLHRQMSEATLLKCSEFGRAVVDNMEQYLPDSEVFVLSIQRLVEPCFVAQLCEILPHGLLNAVPVRPNARPVGQVTGIKRLRNRDASQPTEPCIIHAHEMYDLIANRSVRIARSLRELLRD